MRGVASVRGESPGPSPRPSPRLRGEGDGDLGRQRSSLLPAGGEKVRMRGVASVRRDQSPSPSPQPSPLERGEGAKIPA